MTTEPIQNIVLHGQRYVILPEAEYCRLTGKPPLPEPDAQGNVPAVTYARASLARKLIRCRKLDQAAHGARYRQCAPAAPFRQKR